MKTQYIYLSMLETFMDIFDLYCSTLWRKWGKLINYKFIFQYLHFSIVRLRRAGWPQAGSPVSVSIKIFRWVGKKIKDHLWTGLKTYRVVQKIVSDFYFKSIFIDICTTILLKKLTVNSAAVSIFNHYHHIAIYDWFYVILIDIFSS